MNTITIGHQHTPDGTIVPVRRNVFPLPLDDLRRMVKEAQVECFGCEAKGRVNKRMAAVEVYDSPWQEEPTVIHACRTNGQGLDPDERVYGYSSCLDLLYDESFASFRYFDCDGCGRTVIRQCPSNGYHSYVRYDEDACEEVCLRCYEADMFANGLPRETFDKGQIAGMFCNRGELEEHGYAPVPHYEGVYIACEDDAARFCRVAVALIDAGRKVAVDYERMAIGGLEGYVSMYARRGDR